METSRWEIEMPWPPAAAARVSNGWTKSAETEKWLKRLVPFVRRGPWPKGERGSYLEAEWEPRQRVVLKVHTLRRRTHKDLDNELRSAKPLVDALVTRGWLVDDSKKWADVVVTEECLQGRKPGVRVSWELLS